MKRRVAIDLLSFYFATVVYKRNIRGGQTQNLDEKGKKREYDYDQLFKYKGNRHNVSRSSRRYPLFPTEVAAAGRAACLDLPRAGICASR